MTFVIPEAEGVEKAEASTTILGLGYTDRRVATIAHVTTARHRAAAINAALAAVAIVVLLDVVVISLFVSVQCCL